MVTINVCISSLDAGRRGDRCENLSGLTLEAHGGHRRTHGKVAEIMKANDLITQKGILADKDMSVPELLSVFDEQRISAVPVVDRNRKLVGIITDSDVLSHFIDQPLDGTLKIDLKELMDTDDDIPVSRTSTELRNRVGAIMTPKPVTARKDTPIEELSRLIIEKNIHRVIIMNDDRIAGVVSPMSFLYHIAGVP